jgi:hypothetical protein
MKKLLSILILTFSALTGLAQQTREMICIYRNDGEQNAFFRDEVEAITYSRMDAEGRQQEDIAGQRVVTMDSTYYIPLAAIDSVCFVTPDKTDATDHTDVLAFSLESNTGESFKAFLITDDAIHIKVPHDQDLTALTPKFRHNGIKVLVDDHEIKSGKAVLDFSDFLEPQKLVVEASNGDQQRRKVILYDLPVILINTPDGNPIVTKMVRTEGCQMRLIDTDGKVQDLGTAGVKGRGNATWRLPKKPYSFKLDTKHEILGMKPSKHWNLLANAYYDRTQLRNAMAYELARLTDYPWVQQGAFVELIMNDKHAGLYYLCEKIRIEKDRIEIEQVTPADTTGEALTGGYLLESDITDTSANNPKSFITDYINRTGENLAFYMHWEMKQPDEDIPPQQMEYVREALNRVERLISDPDSLAAGQYRELFDIETAINWWLIQEVTLNEEASRSKNIYMYKVRNGKFVVGPPWDFDAWTFGMYGTRHFYCTKRAFYIRYLLKDPVFLQRTREKWAEYKAIWKENMGSFLVSQRDWIIRAAERNEKMWPDYHPLNFADEWTYVRSTQEMYGALIDQINWMDQKLAEGDFSDWWDNK